MGNSAAMIERHYSKLTATMAADKLAWVLEARVNTQKILFQRFT